ncbi:hypothetical protein QFZ53_001479 [Microbacterium natoriense]|uniref:Uncharacterized protein n=1 Tax=Microbacterium natoriense TaxID=284570 RepID=A0AAW8EVH6_9MICO|nr:hypothetical protein [Microbacterium natoriense]
MPLAIAGPSYLGREPLVSIRARSPWRHRPTNCTRSRSATTHQALIAQLEAECGGWVVRARYRRLSASPRQSQVLTVGAFVLIEY